MAYRKGDRVEIDIQRVTYPGHVEKVSAKGVVVVLDDWRVTKPVAEARVRTSGAPVPPDAPGGRAWPKESRIEFAHEGRLVHATVVSGDMFSVKAVADGGESEFRVSCKGLRPSTKVLPVPEPSVMDHWSVRAYKAVARASEETEAFTAEILHRGEPVIRAANDGRGGCNRYHGAREALDRFHADAKRWLDEANVEHLTEPGDLWVTWYATLRPFAVDAREHLRAFDHQIAQYVHMPLAP